MHCFAYWWQRFAISNPFSRKLHRACRFSPSTQPPVITPSQVNFGNILILVIWSQSPVRSVLAIRELLGLLPLWYWIQARSLYTNFSFDGQGAAVGTSFLLLVTSRIVTRDSVVGIEVSRGRCTSHSPVASVFNTNWCLARNSYTYSMQAIEERTILRQWMERKVCYHSPAPTQYWSSSFSFFSLRLFCPRRATYWT